ncbi:MAG: PEP-CTERM sorting domain-containing protein [Gemmatimonadaceae bacterium]
MSGREFRHNTQESFPMRVLPRRLATFVLAGTMLMLPRIGSAQVSYFQACSQGTLANCANIRLTSTLGAGSGGSNLFQIALTNLGSLSNPTLSTSVYFMSLLTGQAAVVPGMETDAFPTPLALGGATISDASSWNVFEKGDAIFLQSLSNDGVGNCGPAASFGGFGQMANTCGASQSVSFSFSTARAFDPNQFSLAGLEFVATAPGNEADSCNDVTLCTITPQTITPEPSTIVLMIAGLSAIAVVGSRRRKTRGSLNNSEV